MKVYFGQSVQSEEWWYVDVLLHVTSTHIYIDFVTSLFPFFGTWERRLRGQAYF
jgi:hypothetical protein